MIASRRNTTSAFNIQHEQAVTFLRRQDANRYLYPHQIEALQALYMHFNDIKRPNIALVVLPTGCGKTGVAVLAPYVLNTTRVLVITPSLIISQQIFEAFCGKKMFLIQREIIPPGEHYHFRPSGVCITDSQDIPLNLHQDLMVVNAHKIGGQSRVKIEDIPDDRYDLVIVDEAHHYPAPTWKELVDHFPNSKKLFLTATPYYNNEYIFLNDDPDPLCYLLNPAEAVERGVIRRIEFDEATKVSHPEDYPEEAVAHLVRKYLDEHDQQDNQIKHQAMVLTQTKEARNAASDFVDAYNHFYPMDGCETYVGGSPKAILAKFNQGEIRVLVIVGRLLEGFDRKHVSVAAIARNVHYSSRVLFAQFVGRAVRKYNDQDRVSTMVVSHQQYNQKRNFEQFDKVAPDNNVDDY